MKYTIVYLKSSKFPLQPSPPISNLSIFHILQMQITNSWQCFLHYVQTEWTNFLIYIINDLTIWYSRRNHFNSDSWCMYCHFLIFLMGNYLRNKLYSLKVHFENCKIEADETHGYLDINHAWQATEVRTISANVNTTNFTRDSKLDSNIQSIFVNGSIHTTKNKRLNLLPELLIIWQNITQT